MAGNNGIQLPISLQISNLQDVANQIKQFANKNVLADSLGGKKIDSELGKILNRLEQISAKAKTAFTTQADFTSVQKEINQVELSLNKVQGTIKNLGFDELKIPGEFSGQIAALQGRIRELNSSLATFKGTQKEKLVSNVDFMADLQRADPKQAAKWLEKGYDELQKAINDGMTRVNTTLALKAAEYQDKQKIITQNSTGKVVSTQLGALNFIQEAFKSLPKDDKARNTAQTQMADFMKATADEQGKIEFTGFKQGARGLNDFLKYIADSYSFTPEQMTQIRTRLRQQVQELAKEGQKITQTDVIKSMSHDEGLAKKILFGDNANELELAAKKYANDMRDAQRILEEQTKLQGQSDAFVRLKVAFDVPNQEIQQKAEEIAAALKVPTEALQGFEAQILSAATSSPQLAALFQKAAGEISTLNNAVEQGKQKLQSIDNAINKMQGISNFVNRYVGLYAIVRKVTTAVRNAMSNIKDIDKAITAIAVVTNMTQADLWGKIGEYTQMAQQYGVATKEVYTVSQIFYQQGLQTAQVMSLTTETLKMAKIAGIDYSTAANAMTVAVRAFKLEMTEAQSVTDTYSALAAKFAVSSAEIANAMEKTASSAASVGMSLQSTSAFISVMEQTTRESAQNIGSALKSIISRYGEMKASPDKLLNVEGEDVAFNKVDTALKSIGISIKDASGQFRNFDDVIMELAQKWNSLDNNTQRYIATIMAGNRQQSRFIALVSNYDELSRAMDVANNAENASIVQVAKTMDSLETKAQQLKNAFSQIYLDLHAEEGLKSMYDWLTRILKTIGKLGMLKGVVPTLMNIIGVGTGTKKLVGMGMNALQDKKSKIQADTSEFEKEIDRVRNKASQDIVTKVKYEADLSQLQATQTITQSNAMSTAAQLVGYFKGAQPGLTSSNAYDALRNAYNNGELEDPTKRAAFIQNMGIDPNSDKGAAVDTLLQSFNNLKGSADQLGNTLDNIKNSGEQAKTGLDEAGQSGQKVSNDLDQLSNDANLVVNAENNKISAAEEAAQADLEKATQRRIDIEQEIADTQKKLESSNTLTEAERELTQQHLESQQALLTGAKANEDAARSALEKAQADQEGAQSEHEETNANRESAASEFEEASANRGKGGSGGSTGGKYNSNLMKTIGVMSGIARLAGTAVTALGAAHQDRSTDKVETSKLLTGVGNGLSMAGTGASMLMSFGPVAATLGAFGGFLVGGIGAIFDGLQVTLQERIALLKEEASAAKDDSLKQQAKVTSLSSSIDNIKTLQTSMYNSIDDMQAYKDAMNTLASEYPGLISSYDEAGNAIINLELAEQTLLTTRAAAAAAAEKAANAEIAQAEAELMAYDQLRAAASGSFGRERAGAYRGNQVVSTTQVLDENGNKVLIEAGMKESGGAFDYNMRSFDFLMAAFNSLESLPKEISELQKYKNNPDLLWSREDLTNFGEYVRNNSDKGYNIWSQKFNPTFNGVAYNEYDMATKLYKPFQDLDDYITLLKSKETIDESQIDLNAEVDAAALKKFNDLIYENKDLLGGNIKNKDTAARDYFGWTTETINYQQLANAQMQLDNLITQKQNQRKNLIQTSQVSHADNLLQNALLNSTYSSGKTNLISSNGIFKNLLYYGMENASEQLTGKNLADLKISDESQYNEIGNNITSVLMTWLEGQSETAIQQFIDATSDLTIYSNKEDLLSKVGTGIQEVDNAIIDQFINNNEANRNRILNAIYETDDQGNIQINTKLKGLSKMESGTAMADIIGSFFKENTDNPIITKYADYFTSQLAAIDKLAEDGYSELANVRLTALSDIASKLSMLPSKMQNDLFSTITNINFSSFDQIKSARSTLEEYGKNNGQLALIQPLLDSLDEAASNLVFNINTLASELASKIAESASNIDTLISNAKSGFGLDKALEALNSINARSGDTQFGFDELFQYDAALEKYIYTAKGLQTAIQQEEENLKESAQRLQTTKKTELQMSRLASRWNQTAQFEDEHFEAGSLSTTYSNSSELMAKIKTQKGYSQEYAEEYETMAADFLKADDGQAKTWENFLKYVRQKAKDDTELAKQAQQQYDAYLENKKNQYYQAIDWSSLALGTDTTGANKELMMKLAQELGMLNEAGTEFLEGYTGTWEEVIEAYIATLEPEQQDAARAKYLGDIKTSKSQQVSTAINEVLRGAQGTLSETTKALLRDKGMFNNLVESTGVLKSGQDYVHSAVELYNAAKENFETLDEANQAYLTIIQDKFKSMKAVQSIASSGGRLDITSMPDLIKDLGFTEDFSNYYNVETNEWLGQFADVFSTDMFGETTFDWDKMMNLLPEAKRTAFQQSKNYNTYRNAYVQSDVEDLNKQRNLMDTALSSYTNAKEGEAVNISQMPKELKEALGLSGETTQIVSEVLRDNAIMQLDATSEQFNKQTQRWIKESQDSIRSKRGVQATAFQSIIKDKVSKSEAEAFSMAYSGSKDHWQDMMEYLGFTWNETLQEFTASEEVTADKINQMIEANKDNWGLEQYNNALVLEKNLKDLQKNKSVNAIRDLLSNYTNVTNEMIGAFETQFPTIDVDQYVTEVNGKKVLDVAALRAALTAAGVKVDEVFAETMGQIIDDRLAYISSATDLVSSGTTSQTDMASFVEKYNQTMGTTLKQGDLFGYDEILKAFTLKPEYIAAYVERQKQELLGLGWDVQDIDQYIEDTTINQFKAATDISSFLSSENRKKGGQAYKTLQNSMRATQYASLESEELSSYLGADFSKMNEKEQLHAEKFAQKAVEGAKKRNDAKKEAIEKEVEDDIASLEAGGFLAIEVMKKYSETTELTADQIEAAYKMKFNNLLSAMDALEGIQVDSVVDASTRDILNKISGFSVSADGVVLAVGDMVTAYEEIYKQMSASAGHTTSELNSAYARVMTAQDQGNIDTLDALKNASGMTYDALGQLLGKYNIKLEEFMQQENNGVKRDNFGNVKVVSWNDFMKAAGLSELNMSDPQVMEAYSSWVDSRVEFENKEKQRVEDAVDEFKGLTEVKPGDAINVAHLESVMGDSLAKIATQYGAELNEGLLKLGTNTNIPALITAIAEEARDAGAMIPEQLAELADAVEGMLNQITSLIQNGIKGNLSNVDANKLQEWATQSGLGKLDFKKTADGLKLSESSAIALYKALKDTDELQASLVFDDLRESLEATRDEYKDTQSLIEHVNKIRNGTYQADNTISDARKKQYQEELEIAEQILQVRATSEDDSFKFMDKNIPAGQNNPLNYMESWGKAFEAMKATKTGGKDQKGLMGYKDFYNIITEMGNIAEMSGTAINLGKETVSNSEEAAALITKAAGALKVTSDGKMKVDLSNIGVDFATGADKMSKDVNAGIDALAQTQIDMLDSMINLLEVVVAMEQLGDIDVDADNHLDLGEIFDLNIPEDEAADLPAKTLKLSKNYQDACGNIIQMAQGDKDLKNALNSVKVNGTTMYQIFKDASNGQVKVNMSAKEYQETIDAFYQMAISNDYDLDNIAESVQKIFSQSNLKNISIDVGTKTFYLNGDFKYQIDWSNKDAIKAATNALKGSKYAKGLDLSKDAGIKKAISRLVKARNKENISVEAQSKIDYILKLASGEIKINDKAETKGKNKGKFTGTYKGQTFVGATKDQVEQRIKKAIEYENEGFNFKVDSKGNVSGTVSVGSAKITVKENKNGKKVYIAETPDGERKECKNKETALNFLASKGFGEQGTYTYEGKTYNVFSNSEAGVTYSVIGKGEGYVCNGHTFKTFDELNEYLAALELGKGGTRTYDSKKKIETIIKGNTKIKMDFSGKKTKIEYFFVNPKTGQTTKFASEQAYRDYLEAYELSGGKVDNKGNTVYTLDGANVTVEVDGKGNLNYSATFDDGFTVSDCHSAADLKSAIAAHAKLKNDDLTGADGKNNGSGSGATFTLKGQNYKVKVENGKVTVEDVKGTKLSKEEKNKIKKSVEDALKNTPVESDGSAKGEVNSVQVKLASGATVTLDTGTGEGGSANALTLTSAVASVEGEVSAINLTPASKATITLGSGGVGESGAGGTGEDAGSLELTEAVPSVKGEVNEINLTKSNTATVTLGADGAGEGAGGTGEGAGGLELSEAVPSVQGEVSTINLTPASSPTVTLGSSGDGAGTGEGGGGLELNEAVPNVNGDVNSISLNSTENTTVTTTLPENITYEEEVPISATKVKITADEVDAKSIGEQIAKSIEEGLAAHPVTPTVNPPTNTGGGEGTGGGTTSGSVDLSGAIANINTIAQTISNISADGVTAVKNAADEISSDKVKAIQTEQGKIKSDKVKAIGTAEGKIKSDKVTAIQTAQNKIKNDKVTAIQTAQSKVKNDKVTAIQTAQDTIKHDKIDAVKKAIDSISISLDSASASATAKIKVSVSGGGTGGDDGPEAKGNFGAFAKGNLALAGGTRTLVGELGPEMVVSNGRYFLVGQNGAEFVDLEKDAIVFNHRQTERLLSQGGIGSRGVPFTNEQNAISYAKGNVNGPAYGGGSVSFRGLDNVSGRGAINHGDSFEWQMADVTVGTSAARGLTGPAMASASAALAALKQLRAMWQSLQAASAQDLAGLGGGGGGGGGGNNKDSTFIKTLEKWYNWLQEIAKKEQEINYQERLRSKLSSDNVKNGKAYYQSQKASLEALQSELSTTRNLLVSQQNYFKDRIKQLNSKNKETAFAKLYEFDDDGQIKYNREKQNFKINGKTTKMTGFEFLSELNARNNQTGQAKYTAKQQYEILAANGYGKFMQYDSSGNKIEYSKGKPKDDSAYTAAVQAFWDKIDADKDEMQSLHDSISEYSDKILELQEAQNELLQEMQDNQMELEQELLDAVVNKAEKIIKEQQNLRDAYSEASQKMIQGLNDALSKERDKYAKNQEDAELLQLRRRLALLQRSGASSSEIANLQQEIQSKSQDAYFSEQERQINAIQEASNQQIERLDTQIDIQTRALEYQKEHGLLWQDVYDVMAESPEKITDFLMQNASDFFSKSALTKSKTADDWFFQASQWIGFRDDQADLTSIVSQLAEQGTTASEQDVKDFTSSIKETYGDKAWSNLTKDQRAAITDTFKKEYEKTGDFKAAFENTSLRNKSTLNKGASWETEKKKYQEKYGSYWTQEIENKAREAYVTGGSVKKVLENSALWYAKRNSNGTYTATEVKAGNKVKAKTKEQAEADTKDKEYTMTHDWAAYIKSLGARWNALTDKQKNNYKKIYESAYKSAKKDPDVTAQNKLKKDKNFKAWLDKTNSKIYAVYQNPKTHKWSVKELSAKQAAKGKTPSGNKPTTYNKAAADVATNNTKYTQYQEALKKYNKAKKKGKKPTVTYQTRYKYDQGGMVEQTGTALLHAKESVLTSQQTDILRNEILGRSKNSLMNLLLDFKNAYNNIGNAGVTSEPSIIIENASVNMNVGSIANDYDARRAGEQALSEMLKIARKKGAASALRR